MNTQTVVRTSIVVGAVALVGVGVAVALANSPAGEPVDAPAPISWSPTETPTTDDATPAAEPEPAEPESAAYDTTATLRFLIEEEKLAHDVYVTLGELWGAGVFENITESEITHQDLVAPLLDARDIPDPRSAELGVFADPALQSLYDELIARGSTSLEEAVQVGILIEEKDITDLSAAIAAEDEAEIVSVLERLLAGSENHLRSFQRLS